MINEQNVIPPKKAHLDFLIEVTKLYKDGENVYVDFFRKQTNASPQIVNDFQELMDLGVIKPIPPIKRKPKGNV